ncbi:uncharacterized protein BDW70DRAFT_134809 [Aspergillus foveolatus]|uniref:uncharacterized protein n=1 Tax=Aspergillus foveolatus TaxID=210207 RepID=UPI003CCDB08A
MGFLHLFFLPLPLASESSWKGQWLVRQQRAFSAYRYIQNCLHLAGVICLVFDFTAALRAWEDLRSCFSIESSAYLPASLREYTRAYGFLFLLSSLFLLISRCRCHNCFGALYLTLSSSVLTPSVSARPCERGNFVSRARAIGLVQIEF